jgi:hypothetical protein
MTCLVGALLLLAAGCGSEDPDQMIDEAADRASVTADTVAEDLAASTYEAEGAPYGCTQDCSGHEAGWAWAAEHDVRDAADCGGRSESFIEGCIAFAETLQERVNIEG